MTDTSEHTNNPALRKKGPLGRPTTPRTPKMNVGWMHTECAKEMRRKKRRKREKWKRIQMACEARRAVAARMDLHSCSTVTENSVTFDLFSDLWLETVNDLSAGGCNPLALLPPYTCTMKPTVTPQWRLWRLKRRRRLTKHRKGKAANINKKQNKKSFKLQSYSQPRGWLASLCAFTVFKQMTFSSLLWTYLVNGLDIVQMQLKVERIIKQLLSTDWTDKTKVFFALTGILQDINSKLSYTHLRQLINEMYSDPEFATHAASFEQERKFVLQGTLDFSDVSALQNPSLFKGLGKIVLYVLAATKLEPEFFKEALVREFIEDILERPRNLTDLKSACSEVYEAFVSGWKSFKTTGSWKGFFYPQSLLTRAIELLNQKDLVVLRNADAQYTIDQYLTELESIATELKTEATLGPQPKRQVYRVYYDKVLYVHSQVTSIVTSQLEQMTAFSVLLVGSSGVGKSYIAPGLMKYLLELMGAPARPENMAVVKPGKYDDAIENTTTGIVLDDLANAKTTSTDYATSDVVIRAINSIAQPAEKAELEKKGKVFFRPRVVIGTTNNKTLNAYEESNSPASILRRFPLNVTMSVAPAFRAEGSENLDRQKVRAKFPNHSFPNVWNFSVERVAVGPNDEPTYLPVENRYNPSKGNVHKVDELIKTLSYECALHQEAEMTSLQTRSNTEHWSYCTGCRMPKGLCTCYRGDEDFQSPYGDFEHHGFKLPWQKKKEKRHPIQKFCCSVGDKSRKMKEKFVPKAPKKKFLGIDLLAFGSRFNFIPGFWVSLCNKWDSVSEGLSLAMLTINGLFIGMALGVRLWFSANVMLGSLFIGVNWWFKDLLYYAVMRKAADENWKEGIARRAETAKQTALGDFLPFTVWMAVFVGGLYAFKAMTRPVELQSDHEKEKRSFIHDIWHKARAPIKETMSTALTEHVVNLAKKNTVCITCRRDGMVFKSNGFFINNRILLLPKHCALELGRGIWTFARPTKNGEINERSLHVDPEASLSVFSPSKDLAAVYCTGLWEFKDLTRYFRVEHCVHKSSVTSVFWKGEEIRCRNSGVVTDSKVLKHAIAGKQYYVGWTGHSTHTPEHGWCGGPVVCDTKDPHIVGFHVAGRGRDSFYMGVDKDDIDEIVEHFHGQYHTPVVDSSRTSELHGKSVIDTDIHEFCATQQGFQSVPMDVIGRLPGTGKRRFKTRRTPFASQVLEFFGAEDKFAVPPGGAKIVDDELKSPWINCMKELSMCEHKFPQHHIDRAVNEIVGQLKDSVKEYAAKNPHLSRPLTIDEVCNGIENSKLHGMDWNTSAGPKPYDWKGPAPSRTRLKKDWLENDEHPYVLDENMRKYIQENDERLRRGERTVNTLRAALKDEPLKKEKCRDFRTRVFVVDQLPHLANAMKYFSPILNALGTMPYKVRSAIGLNPHSHDWEKLREYLSWDGKVGADHGVFWDIKAFDKTLPANLVKAAWSVYLHLAEAMGYSAEDLEAMKTILEEKSSPYLDLNGTLIQLLFHHTSGNSCTASVGGLANLILTYAAFYEVCDPDGSKGLKAHEHLRSMHLGDDMSGSVKDKKLGFNFVTAQRALKSFGITVTMADKESDATEFQNFDQEDFLKRTNHWCKYRGSYVGLLAEGSIVKMLTWYLPSKSVTTAVQLGSTIDAALTEASLYGKEYFERFHEFAQEIVRENDLASSLIDKSFDDFVVKWALDSCRRYPELRKRERPYLEGIREQGNLTIQEQEIIFGSENVRPSDPSGCQGEANAETVSLDDDASELSNQEWTLEIDSDAQTPSLQSGRDIEKVKETPTTTTKQEQPSGKPLCLTRAYESLASERMSRSDSVETFLPSPENLGCPMAIDVPCRLRGGGSAKEENSTEGAVSGCERQVEALEKHNHQLARERDVLKNGMVSLRCKLEALRRKRSTEMDTCLNLLDDVLLECDDMKAFELHSDNVPIDVLLTSDIADISLDDDNNGVESAVFTVCVSMGRRRLPVNAREKIERAFKERIPNLCRIRDERKKVYFDFLVPRADAPFDSREVTCMAQFNKLGLTGASLDMMAQFIANDSVPNLHGGKALTTNVNMTKVPHLKPKKLRSRTLACLPDGGCFVTTSPREQFLGNDDVPYVVPPIEWPLPDMSFSLNSGVTDHDMEISAKVEDGREEMTMRETSTKYVPLGNFFDRKVFVGRDVISSGGNVIVFRPYEAIYENVYNRVRLQNYKQMVMEELTIELDLNNNAFTMGLYILVYHPLPSFDMFKPDDVKDNMTLLSQRPHMYIDLSKTERFTMTVKPFFSKNMLDISKREWRDLGYFALVPLTTPARVDGSAVAVSVNAYAHATNSELAGTTAQFELQSSGPVEEGANIVKSVAELAERVPAIAPYARKTYEVADAVGKFAHHHGLTPKKDSTVKAFKSYSLSPFSTTDGSSLERDLIFNTGGETTIDPAVVRRGTDDEMAIKHINGKEAILGTLRWNTNAPKGTGIFVDGVTPYLRSFTAGTPGQKLTPGAFVALLYKYWRGEVTFGVHVACTSRHAGKLRMEWDPQQVAATGIDGLNVVENYIFDIATQKSAEFTIGWMQDKHWLPVSTQALPTAPAQIDYAACNGIFKVSVEQPLVAPLEAPSFVEIVFTAKCDCQYMFPHDKVYSTVKLLPTTSVADDPVDQEVLYPLNVSTDAFYVAFYYGWYENSNTFNKWVRPEPPIVGDGTTIQPALGFYNDQSRPLVNDQVSWMRSAGISHLFTSWGGFGHRTQVQLFDTLVLELGPIRYGLLMEMGRFKDESGGRTFTADVENRFTTEMDLIVQEIFLSGTQRESKYWYIEEPFAIGGGTIRRPVFFMYTMRAWPDDVAERFFDIMRTAFANAGLAPPYIVGDYAFGRPRTVDIPGLSAISVYDTYAQIGSGIATVEQVESAVDWEGWRSANPELGIIPTISPGYSDVSHRGNPPLSPKLATTASFPYNDSTSLFKKALETAIGIGTEYIAINSWNEWQETSNIEPTSGDRGDQVGDSGNTYYDFGVAYLNILAQTKGLPLLVDTTPPVLANEFELQSSHEKEIDIVNVRFGPSPNVNSEADVVYHPDVHVTLRSFMNRTQPLKTYNGVAGRLLYLVLDRFPQYAIEDSKITPMNVSQYLSSLYFANRGHSTVKCVADTDKIQNVYHRVSLQISSAEPDTETTRTVFNRQELLMRSTPGPMEIFVREDCPEYRIPYFSPERFIAHRTLGGEDVRVSHDVVTSTATSLYFFQQYAGVEFYYFLGTPAIEFS